MFLRSKVMILKSKIYFVLVSLNYRLFIMVAIVPIQNLTVKPSGLWAETAVSHSKRVATTFRFLDSQRFRAHANLH